MDNLIWKNLFISFWGHHVLHDVWFKNLVSYKIIIIYATSIHLFNEELACLSKCFLNNLKTFKVYISLLIVKKPHYILITYDYISIDITLESNNVSQWFCYRYSDVPNCCDSPFISFTPSHSPLLELFSYQDPITNGLLYIYTSLESHDEFYSTTRDIFPDTCYNFSSIDREWSRRNHVRRTQTVRWRISGRSVMALSSNIERVWRVF